MKKVIIVAIAVLLVAIAVFAFGNRQEKGTENNNQPEVQAGGTLMMATTTSTADTGILEMLVAEFYKDTGIALEYISVGTGEALAIGRNGDVDIVFVHARASEELFVEEGYGLERIPVMYNDFVVIGPMGMLELSNNVEELFLEIHNGQLKFVSRGDNSGTHKMELVIWERLGIDPRENPNYMEAGQGMGATILMTDEMNAFTLTDRGTWLRQYSTADIEMSVIIVCQGDPALFNQYGIIAVNPEVHPEVNSQGAMTFIEWICSERIQELIAEFGVEDFGEPLFVPNAGTDN